MDINIALKPFSDIFTRSQVQSILLAWLPTKLAPYLTGIMAVDMFITTVIASGATAIAYLVYQLITYPIIKNSNNKKSMTIQIEYYALGQYNERKKNIIYESLSWLISQQIKKLLIGSFVLKVVSNKDAKISQTSNILPEIDHETSIEYKKKKFTIKYKIPENKNNSNLNNINSEIISMIAQEKPSIYLSTDNNSVDEIYTLLSDLANFYIEFQKKESGRFRYENNRSHWIQIQKLSSCRGLDSIALDIKQESLLKKELETFVNDRKFYEKIGIPYRRGIMLYGKPGTGKTSLINAISSHLSRDIYYLNLKNVESDNELSALFSSVPSNQLIVLEDVDTQTNIVHKRSNKLKENNKNDKLLDNKKDDKKKPDFSLSSFLSCLDGHILSEGNIIIMTSNHLEFLDPACIRPGRMDLHLELGHCTQYQIKKLFESVISHSKISDGTLKMIPERLLPPCEVMTTLTLYREDNLDTIINRILELVNKYKEKAKIEYIEDCKRKNFKKRKFNGEIKKSRNSKKIKING
jgi:DNA replication protein DnaC